MDYFHGLDYFCPTILYIYMKNNNKKYEGKKENNNGNAKRIRGKKERNRGRGRLYSKKSPKIMTTVQPHRLEGVYIIKSNKELLATKNLSNGESVYGEELITIEERKENNDSESSSEDCIIIPKKPQNIENKVEYRIWDIFYSKLGALIENGIQNIFMKPGSKVLCLGAGNDSFSTISHISDLVGEDGTVYAVEISEIKGLNIKNMAKKRENITTIINDAKRPYNYKNLISDLVDCIYVDISSEDLASIISINAGFFLKNKGGFICVINDNNENSNLKSQESKFDQQIKLLREYNLYVKEFISLESFAKGYAIVSGIYKPHRESIEED